MRAETSRELESRVETGFSEVACFAGHCQFHWGGGGGGGGGNDPPGYGPVCWSAANYISGSTNSSG